MNKFLVLCTLFLKNDKPILLPMLFLINSSSAGCDIKCLTDPELALVVVLYLVVYLNTENIPKWPLKLQCGKHRFPLPVFWWSSPPRCVELRIFWYAHYICHMHHLLGETLHTSLCYFYQCAQTLIVVKKWLVILAFNSFLICLCYYEMCSIVWFIVTH